MSMHLGEKVRSLRLERGWTQKDLARDIVTVSMISQIEAGKARPSCRVIAALAERLGVEASEFHEHLQCAKETDHILRHAKPLMDMGQFTEAWTLLSAVVNCDKFSPEQTEIQLLVGECLIALERYSEVMEMVSLVLEQAVRRQDHRLAARALLLLGQAAYRTNEFVFAKWLLQRSLGTLDVTASDDTLRFDVTLLLSQTLLAMGKTAEAVQTMDPVRPLCARIGDMMRVADFARHFGRLMEALGDEGQATLYQSQAQMLYELAGRGAETDQ